MNEPVSKRRGWLIAATLAVGLAVLVLLGLYAFVATIDVATHRERIEALVSRSLDREVRIGGAMRSVSVMSSSVTM